MSTTRKPTQPQQHSGSNGNQPTIEPPTDDWQPSPPVQGAAVLRVLLKAMRPKQWLKNGLLFVAPAAALRLTDSTLLLKVVAAFVIFCFVSSAIYLINDLVDIESDRRHPTKRNRPLASGKLRPVVAQVVAAVLLVAMVPAAFLLNLYFGAIVVGYIVNAILYDFFFKRIVLIDLFSLSVGFVLRVIGGALVIAVPISPWLYLCTLFAALFIGINKRRHELMLLEAGAGRHRKILDEYSPQLLDQLSSLVTSALVIAYSLYTWQGDQVSKKNNLMMATIPFALFVVFRYLYLIYQRDEGGAPEELLTRDKWLIGGVVAWLLTAGIILYFFKDTVVNLS